MQNQPHLCIYMIFLFQSAFFSYRNPQSVISHNYQYHFYKKWKKELPFRESRSSYSILFLKTEFHVWYPDNDWKKKQAPPFRQYIRYRFIVITFYRYLIMFYLILVYIMPIIEQNGGNSYGIYSRYSRQSCSYYTV